MAAVGEPATSNLLSPSAHLQKAGQAVVNRRASSIMDPFERIKSSSFAATKLREEMDLKR